MREMKDSGIDWIGNVPSEWRNSKVKHIASFYNGDRSKAYPSGDDIKTSGVPFLTSDNVHGLYVETGRKKDKFLSDAKYRELNGAKLQIGDIVFCLRGSLGACGLNLNLKEGTVASSLTVLRPNQDEVIPEFLNYCLHSPVVLIQTDYLMNGSCADNLSAHSVGNYCICIPPMQEQCQITRYLDERCAAIDEDVAKRREVIEKLKEYKKSLIAHAVTKGLDPNVEMKASGVEWIGEVPASWDMLRIYQLAFPVKNKNEGMKENNLLSLSYGNIVQKDINKVDGLVPASYEGYNIIEPGDIVLRFTDLQNDQRSLRTGLCSFNGIITSAYLTIRPRHELVSSEYFHYVLHFVDTLKVFYNMGGGMRQSLDWHGVSHMFLPIPPQAEQCRIVAYLDERCAAIDEDVAKRREVIEKLKEYKKSLIAHAVTKGLDPNTEMKDSGVDWIGEIPVSWIIAKAKSCLNFSNARNPGNQEAQVLSLYREYGVIPKSSRDDNHNRTSEDTSDYKNVRPGDLVINKMKAWQGSLGLSEYEGIVSPAYFVYRVNQKSIKGRYLHYLVRSDLYAQRWNALSYGIREGQWDLHREDFESDYLIFPPLSEQSQIVSYLDKRCAKIDEAISRQEQLIEKLGEYRKSIIHHAVTGKIDCTEA